ncbi:MAG: hypothetical protein OEZ06_01475 [Myxococcales bacterium]|nr:hypothetical protein [Myxococcales bacterium]
MPKSRCRPSRTALGSLLALALLGLCPTLSAQQAQGFAELRTSLFPGAGGDVVQVVERARPTFTADVSERVAITATIEAALSQGRRNEREVERVIARSDFGPLLEAAGCSFGTHENRTLAISEAGDYLDVDRLFVDAYLPWADIRAGRQALHWGSGRFFNPTDPFPQVLLSEPWRPRRGVNAGRITVPFGEVHDATAVVATTDRLDRVHGAGRLSLNFFETDFALVGSYRGDREDGFAGLDIRGTLGVGFWLEGGVRIDSDPHQEFVVGVDYSFPLFESLLVTAQYYHNGSGATDPDDYRRTATIAPVGLECTDPALEARFSEAEPDPFAPMTSARDYGLLGASLAWTPDFSTNLFWLQNLDDGSGLVVPTAAYVILDWLDISISAQIPLATWGDGGEFKPRDGDLLLQQDLGTGQVLLADFSPLMPDAVITLWSRASY